MTTRLKEAVSASWLSERLGLKLLGEDRQILEVCVLDKLAAGGLSFVLRGRAPECATAGTVFARADAAANGLSIIASPNPRLDFIRGQHILDRTPGFAPATEPPNLHPTVQVGPHTTIENGVEIGEGTRIGSSVVIKSGTRIGKFCDIKSGAIIGEPGFGFERDPDGRPWKMIHLGGVLIGDHVEIGALNTIVRGALGETVLEDYVKTDDHVHIAHNCHIGERTLITACAELSGSVTVGREVWISPNCTITQKVTIGDKAFIGIGAVVLRDVEPGVKVFGNPAKPLMGGFGRRRTTPLHRGVPEAQPAEGSKDPGPAAP